MWGDPGVTELQILKDASINVPTTGATPTVGGQQPMTLQHVGLLKRLRLRLNIPIVVASGTTGPAKDVNGPWDLIGLFRADVNGIAPLYAVSGWGMFLISLISDPFMTVDVDTTAVTSDPAVFTEVFQFPTIPSGAGNYQLTADFDLPFTVDILLPQQALNLPTELGLWLLQNQTVDMVLTFGINPLQSATPGFAPYQGGNLVYSYGAATIDIEREFYRIPQQPANMPLLAWAHQWVEAYIPFAGSAVDFTITRAGIVLRIIVSITDGATNDGVLGSKITAMSWIYGANETPIIEDNNFMRARQLRDYGKLLPKGVFLFDWYKWGSGGGSIGSFKLTYNTEALVNERVHFDFSSALAAGTYARVLVERLVPIIPNRNASPVATSGAPVGAQQAPVGP